MASKPLVDTYKRYKAGTSKLVTWLSESARLCDKTGYLTTKHSRSRKVSTDDLVILAQRIVDSKDPIIEIALDILDITKDAITGRSQAAQFYSSLAQDESDTTGSALHQANTSHQYFLAVLEQVFEILRKEHKARRPKRKKQMPVLASDTNDLTNLYHHLQLEETAEDSDLPPSGQSQNPRRAPGKATKTETYSLDNELEEKHFQIWCLLKDLFNVRSYARSVWALYNEGAISLMAACKMAENAMTMSYSLSASFDEVHPDLNNFDKIINFIGAQSFYYEALRKNVHYGLCRMRGVDREQPSENDWSDLLCAHAWRSLSDFREVQGYVWMSQVDRQKIYGGKKPVLKYAGHPFSKVLVNLAFDAKAAFPELARWVRDRTGAEPMPSVIYSLDDYTSCLLRFSQSRRMETGHVAATQLYMEMYDALDGDLARGIHEFGSFIHEAEMSRLSVESNEGGKEDVWKWSPFCSTGENVDGDSGWFVPSSCPTAMERPRLFFPVRFLSAMPMLAGHLGYTTLYRHQKANLISPLILNEIASATHLYKAAQISGSIHEPWVDMEFFRNRQAEMLGCTWGAERTMRSVVNKFGMSLGLSIRQVSEAKQPTLPRPNQVIKSIV